MHWASEVWEGLSSVTSREVSAIAGAETMAGGGGVDSPESAAQCLTLEGRESNRAVSADRHPQQRSTSAQGNVWTIACVRIGGDSLTPLGGTSDRCPIVPRNRLSAPAPSFGVNPTMPEVQRVRARPSSSEVSRRAACA